MLIPLLALVIQPITLRIHPDQILNRFRPDEALGAGIDGHEAGMLDQTFRPKNLEAMKSAGLRPLTYRLRTELGVEAWHWNPEGTWSDPGHKQGYFVGNPIPNQRIERSYGYRLPRRGDSIDQANNDGYSRIDDGDPKTFWKSNPYLDQHYTGVANDAYPQWVLIDLEKPTLVDTLRVDWAQPYATRYRVQYWTGEDAVSINDDPEGEWKDLRPEIATSQAGPQTIHFASKRVRFVRLFLLKSSNTSLEPSTDIRDRLGFAVREISLGTTDRKGQFHDLIRHGKKRDDQTNIIVSSTDPWHRASDIDKLTEQPGFDALMDTGLTSGLPLLMATSALYDNPETAGNQIRWLKARGYPLRGIEIGEEPDGQYATPEHYSQLYEQVAREIRKVDKSVPLGGPCYQTSITDVYAWPDAANNRSWSNRFYRYLKKQKVDLQFFTFEWYPWDNTLVDPYPQLLKNADLIKAFVKRQRNAGIPSDIPWMMTEYGYSAFSGEAEVDLPGGILNADIVGTFLASGGDVAYLYGYEPNELIEESKDAWGNLMMLQADGDGDVQYKLPTYWTAWLTTHVWTLPGHEEHSLCSVSGGTKDVSAFACHRPDGRIAVMILNKNPRLSATIKIDAKAGDFYAYGPKQFRWQANGEHGHPSRSMQPVVTTVVPKNGLMIQPYSINVLLLEH